MIYRAERVSDTLSRASAVAQRILQSELSGKGVRAERVSGTLSRASAVAQRILQSELCIRLGHPALRTLLRASFYGGGVGRIADIDSPGSTHDGILPLRLVRKGYLTPFRPDTLSPKVVSSRQGFSNRRASRRAGHFDGQPAVVFGR